MQRPGGSETPAVWSMLWKQKVPRKIQIFNWRALHGIIPLKSALANRHVGSNGACPICHQDAEDVCHLLFDCCNARELWERLGMSSIIQEAMRVDRSGSVVLEHLLLAPDMILPIKPNLQVKQVLMVACWYLWWIRREITHDGNPPPPMRRHTAVLAIAANFHEANLPRSVTNPLRWMKPDIGFVKLNVDAAYFAEEGKGATAAVIRDEKGNFLAAQCIYITHTSDAMMAEAMAMRDGLTFANSLGFPRVEAESDSLNVINFCDGQSIWWDAAAAIFAECLDVSTSIGKVVFKHCSCSLNKGAHVLANYSFCNRTSVSWTAEPPGCMVSTLVDDVMPMFNQ